MENMVPVILTAPLPISSELRTSSMQSEILIDEGPFGTNQKRI
ncbi:hypothetical protein FACS1894130_12840 [Spirochaetia bacterium]|nr:hypothetical protein FACS1894130_12840 [Spirochaetia bacterium]